MSIEALEQNLLEIANKIVRVEEARVVVEPTERKEGCWFGSGNMIRDKSGLYLIGRYRDTGDSRFGVKRGRRGWKVSIFKMKEELEKTEIEEEIISLEKNEEVLSYEGSWLFFDEQNNLHALISSEKKREYPSSVSEYQKEGTGIWSIDHFHVDLENRKLEKVSTILESRDPCCLHFKDPNVVKITTKDNKTRRIVIFCGSSYCWSTAVSCFMEIEIENKNIRLVTPKPQINFLGRGMTWDVGMSRITGSFKIPQVGIFSEYESPITLFFYDGCECVNNHDDSKKKNTRKYPRGYSCEEVAGIAYGFDHEFPRLRRLSRLHPSFFSREGTGCCRYISVFSQLPFGKRILCLYQKSMDDFSQPLVSNFLNL